jgi:hypothetical protein
MADERTNLDTIAANTANGATSNLAIGTKADAPASGTQTTADGTLVGLLKGAVNYLYGLFTAFGTSGTQIGPITTTASDVDSFTATSGWSVLGFKKCTMILHNTHATLTLIYTIIGYPGAITGNGTTEFTGTLAALTKQEFVIEKKYNKIVCNVKDGSGHATYTLDYCGGQ